MKLYLPYILVGMIVTVNAGIVPIGSSDSTTSEEIDLRQSNIDRSSEETSHALQKRENDVVGTNITETDAVNTALNNCGRMADRASAAALSEDGTNLMYYFGDNSDDTRTTVSYTLGNVSAQCWGQLGTPNVTLYTEESPYRIATGTFFSQCQSFLNFIPSLPKTDPTMVNAFPDADNDMIVFCPNFYNMTAIAADCWDTSQVGTVIHEMTHMSEVMENSDRASLQDLAGGYGTGLLTLLPEDRLDQADTFQYYANAVSLGCVNGKLPG